MEPEHELWAGTDRGTVGWARWGKDEEGVREKGVTDLHAGPSRKPPLAPSGPSARSHLIVWCSPAPGEPPLSARHITVLHRERIFFFFYQLKDGGNPAPSKSISFLFPGEESVKTVEVTAKDLGDLGCHLSVVESSIRDGEGDSHSESSVGHRLSQHRMLQRNHL